MRILSFAGSLIYSLRRGDRPVAPTDSPKKVSRSLIKKGEAEVYSLRQWH